MNEEMNKNGIENELEAPHMSIEELENALEALANELAWLEETIGEHQECENDMVSKVADAESGLKSLDGEKALDEVAFAFKLSDDSVAEGDSSAAINESSDGASNVEYIDEEGLFILAARLVVEEGVASASFLQRRLEIGYGVASKIVTRLEELDIVGRMEGNLPRKILVSADKLERILEAL